MLNQLIPALSQLLFSVILTASILRHLLAITYISIKTINIHIKMGIVIISNITTVSIFPSY